MTAAAKTAVIYVRVSTGKQAERELPLESQMHECRRSARELGATVMAEFVEPGRSAYHDKRTEFQKALVYCERYLPNYFITWDTERFSRRVAVGYSAEERLERVGTEIIYSGFNAGEDPDSRFLNVGMRRLMGELASRSNSKNTKRSMILNAKNGYFNGGHTPFGYDAETSSQDKKKKYLKINDAEAEIVKKIFQMRLKGMGGKAISVYLNERKLLNRGKKWSKSSICDLLRNQKIIGYQVYGRKDKRTGKMQPRENWIIVKSHEPIISEKIFNKVQEMMDGQITNTGGSVLSNFMFTGLLTCGDCGASMQIQTATGRNKTYSYYNCRNAIVNGTCSNKRRSADKLDEFLSSEILDKLLDEKNMLLLLRDMNKSMGQWSRQASTRHAKASAELKSLHEKNDRLFGIMESQGQGADVGAILSRINLNEKRIQQLELELMELKANKPEKLKINKAEIARIRHEIERIIKTDTCVKTARAIFSSIIQRIVVQDTIIVIYYRPDMIFDRHGFAGSGARGANLLLLRTKELVLELPPELQRKKAA